MHKLLLIPVLLAGAAPASKAAAIVIGGFGASRASDSSIIEGPLTQDLRSSLATNFPGSTLVALDTLTPASLSTLNVVIVGSATIAPPATVLSTSEQTALLDFIRSGHNAIIYVDNLDFGGPPNDSFLEPFGMHSTGKVQGVANSTAVALTHPVITGPFGTVTTFATSFGGWFDDLGPNAMPLTRYDANGEIAVAAIAPGALGPNSGGVVFFGDADALVDTAVGGLFHEGDNEKLFLNAVVPEPSTISLLAGAGALLGLRRRKSEPASFAR